MTAFNRLLAAAAACLTLSTAPALSEEHGPGIHIHDAYARTMGGMGASGAVFFLIHNNTDADVTITGAASDVAKMVELHTHIEDANGVMQMRPIEGGVALPYGEMHEFKRGADHVMLMGLTRELADGDTVTVTLSFDGADPVTFDAVVDNARKPAEGGMQGMDHSQMGHGHQHGAAMAPDTAGLSDPEAITAIMKAQFDTPEAPLTVAPVVVAGDHALASWAQADKGGRALLERRAGVWTIVLCGGEDLRLPDFLAAQGVTGAEALSQMFNSAEDALGAEKVGLYSSFEGVVMISPPAN